MNRREALQRFSIIIGGSLLGADSMLAKQIDWDNLDLEGGSKGIGIFSKAQIKLMNEAAETIIPTTSTPGAKAAKTGEFIALIVSDCYEPEKQKAFVDGLAKFDADCVKLHRKPFLKCKAAVQHDYLVALDKEQKEFTKTKAKDAPHHPFKVFKDLVLWGYFTSEIGATQALRYVAVPGSYKNIDYKKGDKAWGG